MIEVGVALSLLAVISLVTVSAFGSARSGVRSGTATPLLRTAQLELRRTTTATGAFAADPVAVLTTAGITAGPGDQPAGTISVRRVNDATVLLAAASADDCLVLVDRPAGSTTWAQFAAAGPTCDAALLETAALALPHEGTATTPQEVAGE